MLLEIVDAFREAIIAIVQSAVNTSMIVLKCFVSAALIFRNGVSSANPLEIFIVLALFAAIGYFIYKFVASEAVSFVKYAAILIILFLITISLL